MILLGCPWSRIAKSDQALIDRRLPYDLCSGELSNTGHQSMRMCASAIDQIGYARPAKLS
jgi:hypothetical protein